MGSAMVNESHLPVQTEYTEAELLALTLDAGLSTANTDMHVMGNFKKIDPDADGVKRINIFKMEGLPNEHLTSTGINDCITTYNSHGVQSTPPCMLPNKHFFDLFWKVASLDGDSRSMSYADLAMGEDYGLFADLDSSFPGNEAAGSIRGAFFFLLDIAQDRHCSMSEATMRQINIDREMP